MIERTLIAAASLAFLIGIAHSSLGERYILRRLFRRRDLPHLFGSDSFTRQTLRFAWHLTTIAWFGLGAILVLLGSADSRLDPGAILRAISLTFLVSFLIALISTRGRHLSWMVFLAIALLSWLPA